MTKHLIIIAYLCLLTFLIFSQNTEDKKWLSIDRIYQSGDFQMDYFGQARWIQNGNAYTT